MIIIGISVLLKSDFMIRRKLLEELGEHRKRSYLKGLVLPYLLLGLLFISMGILEEMNVLKTPVFIALYFTLSAPLLGMLLRNNKKHLGRYLT